MMIEIRRSGPPAFEELLATRQIPECTYKVFHVKHFVIT
jgi:hypothetical protein